MKLVTFEDDDWTERRARGGVAEEVRDGGGGEAPVERATLRGTISPPSFRFDGAKLSPAFGKLGGLGVGDEEAVAKLAEEGVKFLTGKK